MPAPPEGQSPAKGDRDNGEAPVENGEETAVDRDRGRDSVRQASAVTAFEVNYTPSGNLTVDRARSRSLRRLVTASALALWSAVWEDQGRQLGNWH